MKNDNVKLKNNKNILNYRRGELRCRNKSNKIKT